MNVATLINALNFLEAPKRLFADVGKKKPEMPAGMTRKVERTCEPGLENVATKSDITKLTRAIERNLACLEVRVMLGLVAFTGIAIVFA